MLMLGNDLKRAAYELWLACANCDRTMDNLGISITQLRQAREDQHKQITELLRLADMFVKDMEKGGSSNGQG